MLRGLAADWPAVQAGRRGDAEFIDYLKRFISGARAQVVVGQPEIGGRFFYTDDVIALLRLNYERVVSRHGLPTEAAA